MRQLHYHFQCKKKITDDPLKCIFKTNANPKIKSAVEIIEILVQACLIFSGHSNLNVYDISIRRRLYELKQNLTFLD